MFVFAPEVAFFCAWNMAVSSYVRPGGNESLLTYEVRT